MEWMQYGLIDSLSGSSSRVGVEDGLFHRILVIGNRVPRITARSEWMDGSFPVGLHFVWNEAFLVIISVGLIPCLIF